MKNVIVLNANNIFVNTMQVQFQLPEGTTLEEAEHIAGILEEFPDLIDEVLKSVSNREK